MFYYVSVIQALVALVNDPEPEHPLRAELAEEYLKDKKKFFKIAEEYTRKHSEKRPAEWKYDQRISTSQLHSVQISNMAFNFFFLCKFLVDFHLTRTII